MSQKVKIKAVKDYQSYHMRVPSKGKRIKIGVVDYYIHHDDNTGAPIHGAHKIFSDLNAFIELIRTGLPVYELDHLQASLDVPNDALGPMLGISRSTINRIKGKGRESRLDPTTSDKVVRFARLMGKAVNVFGNPEDARKWLSSPQFGLGGAIPFDYAITELGAREVENLLGRIEHGVYS